ncbi:hypothetical protein CLAFUW4_10673 [Fulvia fulva]|uniref:Uncharacterized protein n=1 Tax=Passalora fulva TaxID=5499 RepID=A0A9Q8P811_PASFU|nr:uncharacterized protein CLAFUR5_05286 [Fulvia fulva]KAK4615633.1 hypothetical protein CLAFUR4_10678 [Fulvia fulva]KAK4616568.1 hypothetical protein CLAFUR0_10565 [Fulvia fulva]UJO16588.1 hypothetical protein CLAFUR5_05286 [Fulvia fulva]WPV18832.1 hypothetical protein CLAFUW4_10673 [Fulvia fulva]WPV34422.1 hypothetical protein CLAFUW7_10675 [Fulvia fulva]
MAFAEHSQNGHRTCLAGDPAEWEAVEWAEGVVDLTRKETEGVLTVELEIVAAVEDGSRLVSDGLARCEYAYVGWFSALASEYNVV